jgi:glycosyltransferase involved in cell wall biosynthesis
VTALRVAVVNRHPNDAVGGSELQCHLLARALTERGHDVVYLAVGGGTTTVDEPYRIVPASTAGAALGSAIVATRPDVVYWRYGRHGLTEVMRATRRAGIPVVLAVAHVDDVARWPSATPLRWSAPRTALHQVRVRLRHRLAQRAVGRVAAIAAQREDFLDRVPVAVQRFVPNAADVAVEDFPWPRPYVAWVGNLKARKRPELCRDLADALAPHGVDLLVAGALQDPRYAWLTERDPGRPNLHHLGLLPYAAAAGLVRGARALAVTSRPEGLSNTLIAAWWWGTPTVSLDYDPDGLIAGRGLGAVAGGALDRFLADVITFSSGGAAAVEAGVRAQQLARERFDPTRSFDLAEELLQRAATSGS